MFTGVAVMALAFPDQMYEAIFDKGVVSSKTSTRLYGGALFSISLIFWNSMYTSEKVIIRWTLLTEACYFSIQLIVTTVTMIESGSPTMAAAVLLSCCLFFLLVSFYFYYQYGRRPKKI
ncbi:PREDICTED: tumor protein p53-inducible protein 11 [Nanorana parkeri]|uniref:tumor protein p53-inducible protein 11 n=1 Tax=Nanorana parkeri TaxID=125878 RepID=UPI000854772B|nr:PREDICTED: tumor protein p53-inducible protein 11 [Nanorana parkeri]